MLVIPKAKAGEIKTVADLKGKTIGISSPGSATHIFIARLLQKAGMKIEDAKYIAVGNGPSAVAAIRKGGELDALVNLDPNISELEAGGDVVVLVDGRSPAGMKEVSALHRQQPLRQVKLGQENPNSAGDDQRHRTRHEVAREGNARRGYGGYARGLLEGQPGGLQGSTHQNMSSFLWDGLGKVEAQRVLETIAISSRS